MKEKDFDNVRKYLQIRVFVDGESENSAVIESLQQDGTFTEWLGDLQQNTLDGMPILPFYSFKRGALLIYNGKEYLIDDIVVEFYSDYPNPGGMPAIIVKLYLKTKLL